MKAFANRPRTWIFPNRNLPSTHKSSLLSVLAFQRHQGRNRREPQLTTHPKVTWTRLQQHPFLATPVVLAQAKGVSGFLQSEVEMLFQGLFGGVFW